MRHPPDLGVPADHGVEPACGSIRDQIPAVFLQGLVGGFRHGRGHPLVAADPGQLRQEGVFGEALVAQQPARGRRRAFAQQGEHQVLDRYVLVLEPRRLLPGHIKQPGQPLGDIDLAGRHARTRDARPSGYLSLKHSPQPVGVRASLRKQAGHDAFRLLEEREQQVLAVDFGVAEAQRLRLGVMQGLLRLLREPSRVHVISLLAVGPLAGQPQARQSGRAGRRPARPPRS